MRNIDVYELLRKLAKSITAQNLFLACKESRIQIFKNNSELSRLQQIYLSYLYFYDTIDKDLAIKKISKHIKDNILFEDAYMLWKKEKEYKEDTSSKKENNLKLVSSKKIKFPRGK